MAAPWIDPSYRVGTPEQIGVEYPVAGIGSRFLAALVDFVVLIVLLLVIGTIGSLGMAVLVGAVFAIGGNSPSNQSLGLIIGAFAVLVWFVMIWGYFVFFELLWHGQTPGKRWLGLRVIKEGGYPVGLPEVVIRNIVRFVDFLPFYYIVGVIVMFVDSRSRRLGDLAAGTLVVRERDDVRLESVTAELERIATATVEPGAPIPNLDRLGQEDASLLRDYLGRRTTLRREAAAALAIRLSANYVRRLEHDLGAEAPESFLERLAAQLGTGRTV